MRGDLSRGALAVESRAADCHGGAARASLARDPDPFADRLAQPFARTEASGPDEGIGAARKRIGPPAGEARSHPRCAPPLAKHSCEARRDSVARGAFARRAESACTVAAEMREDEIAAVGPE